MPDFPELSEIFPEYRSRNPLVRWIFDKRLEIALEFSELDELHPLAVLDLGCGEGRMLRLLHERFPRHRLTGIDHNPNVRKLSIPGVEIDCRDFLEEGDLGREAFDRILCLDVLEHVMDVDGPLASIRAALKPGGLLILSAPSEGVFHKACRFLIKGTFSEKAGPCSSPHYHRASTLRKAIVDRGFTPLERRSLPLPGPLALLEISSYRKAPPGP